MKGDDLQRLEAGADRLIRENERFLKGQSGHEYLNEDEISKYVEEIDFIHDSDTPGRADLEALEEELREVKNDYEQGSGKMDTEAAEAVRKHIDLTRAQAADHGIWHDLSIRKYPWFVRHRWSFEGEAAMRKKFWTHGVALDSQSCTFERLWWIAELTRVRIGLTESREGPCAASVRGQGNPHYVRSFRPDPLDVRTDGNSRFSCR